MTAKQTYDKARQEAVRRLVAKHSDDFIEIFKEVKVEFGIKDNTYAPVIRQLPREQYTKIQYISRKRLRDKHPEVFLEIYAQEKQKLSQGEPMSYAYNKAFSHLTSQFSKEYIEIRAQVTRELIDTYAKEKS